MGLESTGRAIAHLRKQAGLTQRDIADRLGISDKAVSKWERGLSLPDISCLERLAEILDTETDSLLAGAGTHTGASWHGVLSMNDDGTGPCAGTTIYDKPLVYFLLSNFLLAGIREIQVLCSDRDRCFIEETLGDGVTLGISLHCGSDRERISLSDGSTMLMLENHLLYGTGLTRRMQKAMTETARATAFGPLLFLPHRALRTARIETPCGAELTEILERSGILDQKPVPRGFLEIALDTWEGVADAATLARLVRRHGGLDLCNLEEIAQRRGFIAAE